MSNGFHFAAIERINELGKYNDHNTKKEIRINISLKDII